MEPIIVFDRDRMDDDLFVETKTYEFVNFAIGYHERDSAETGEPMPDLYAMGSDSEEKMVCSSSDSMCFEAGQSEYSVFHNEEHPTNPPGRIIPDHLMKSDPFHHEEEIRTVTDMTIRNYQDFVIYSDSIDNAGTDQKGRPAKYSLRVFDSPIGEGEHEEEITVPNWDQIETWRTALADRTISDGDFKRFARTQGVFILLPYVRELYRCSLAGLQQGGGLRIRLRRLPELACLLWEVLYDPREADYMRLSLQTPVVRYIEVPQTVEPLTVAAASATPRGTPPSPRRMRACR